MAKDVPISEKKTKKTWSQTSGKRSRQFPAADNGKENEENSDYIDFPVFPKAEDTGKNYSDYDFQQTNVPEGVETHEQDTEENYVSEYGETEYLNNMTEQDTDEAYVEDNEGVKDI